MELKLGFFFLIFCAIREDSCAGSQWLINVPSTIPAVQGSCVLIPCTYSYPKLKRPVNRWRGFWKTGNKTVATNVPKWRLANEFNKRTRLMGNLESGNCTMLLKFVRTTDVGPFYFTIEMSHYRPFTFSKNTVSIDVLRNPEPPSLTVQVTDQVTATCSVSYSCPYTPKISWNHRGLKRNKVVKVNKGMWRTLSVLKFSPVSSDFNQPLNCTVLYLGGKKAESSVILIN